MGLGESIWRVRLSPLNIEIFYSITYNIYIVGTGMRTDMSIQQNIPEIAHNLWGAQIHKTLSTLRQRFISRIR